MHTGDWELALAIAARFPELGAHRNKILRGHEAYTNPRFYQQIGYDLDTLKEAGKQALINKYGDQS